MASIEEKCNSINSFRTNLLLLVNEELSKLKKNSILTRINSKKITEAEEHYSSGNNYIVKLQEENFIPSSITRDVIQSFNVRSKFSYKSPDSSNLNGNFVKNRNAHVSNLFEKKNFGFKNDNENNKLDLNNLDSNYAFEVDLFNMKSDISMKKNQHFKLKTLKINEGKKNKLTNFYFFKSFIFILYKDLFFKLFFYIF